MTSCASHAAPTRPPRPASTSREPGELVGRHDVIAQTPALRRRLLEQRDGWRAAGVCTSAPGARASRLERARPRRSHLWQAGAARCHVRGSRRSSEPTSWERSDGHGWQRWFQSGGASAAQQSARLYADGKRHVRRVGVAGHPPPARGRPAACRCVCCFHRPCAASRSCARSSARCPRAERLDHFAPPISSRPEGEPAGRR
jgi:hypothetical protein